MNVGIVTEGQSEVAALPDLLGRVQQRCQGIRFLRPVLAPFDPHCPAGAIAKACLSRVEQLAHRDADLVVVLFDRDHNEGCCGALAANVRAAITSMTKVPIEVVVKNRAFENWLIADLDALRAQPGRFNVTSGMRAQIEPNKADGANALMLLKNAVVGRAYSKVEDAKRITARAAPETIAQHSRSFRRFLRTVRDPHFVGQSRYPK